MKNTVKFKPKIELKHIKKAFKDLDEFDDTAQLYLIKKSKSSKLEKQLILERIEITSELEFFKKIIRDKLKRIKSTMDDTADSIQNFFNDDHEDTDLLEISPKDIPVFPNFLKKLKTIDEITRLSELQDKVDFDSFAVDFNIDGCRIIWFRNIPRNKLIIGKNTGLLNYKSGTFEVIDNTVFSFDYTTDAVYFQSSNSIVVCNKDSFERIFNFYEYYKIIAEKELDDLKNMIEISDEMYNLESKIKICKDIVDIKNKNGFPSIDRYKYYQNLFNELRQNNEELKEKYTSINIINNKIEISNANQLQTLVSIARSDILHDPITKEYYKALKKVSLRK